MILASLLLAAAAVQAQTTSWNGHTYEAIWFPQEWATLDPGAAGWWGSPVSNPELYEQFQPSNDAAARGGHPLTIESMAEFEVIRLLGPELRAKRGDLKLAIPMGQYTDTPDYKDYLCDPESSAGGDMFLHIAEDGSSPQCLGLGNYSDSFGNDVLGGPYGMAFYILEIDPPIGPVDTDGDGLTDDQEKNTRHSYSFVQAPTPVDPVAKTGGFTRDECIADAIARGGHLVDLSSDKEFLAAKDALQPWMVGIAFNFLSVTPLLNPFVNLNGQFLCIRSNGADMQYPSNDCCWDPLCMRFSTYILEIEDSTDPNNPDTDADGLTDGQEVLTTLTDPLNADSDGDQLLDGIEVNTTKTNPLAADSDADGLDDYVEVATHKTNPLLADTDGDGFDDKLEVDKGTNPLDPASLPVVQLSVYPAIEIEFPTKAGEVYQIQTTTDLVTWVNFGDPFTGTGQPYARFIAAREQASFLRAVIVK